MILLEISLIPRSGFFIWFYVINVLGNHLEAEINCNLIIISLLHADKSNFISSLATNANTFPLALISALSVIQEHEEYESMIGSKLKNALRWNIYRFHFHGQQWRLYHILLNLHRCEQSHRDMNNLGQHSAKIFTPTVITNTNAKDAFFAHIWHRNHLLFVRLTTASEPSPSSEVGKRISCTLSCVTTVGSPIPRLVYLNKRLEHDQGDLLHLFPTVGKETKVPAENVW